MRALVVALAVAAPGCTAEISVTAGETVESDDACVAAPCHQATAREMEHESSHTLLMRCRDCHELVRLDATPGHALSASCADCHSQSTHADTDCEVCHTPHGSSNAFLLRESLVVDEDRVAVVRVVRPEGASWSGLARAGVPGAEAGTGVCEVCHERTRYYDRAGQAEPHDATWCESCHPHDAGFATLED